MKSVWQFDRCKSDWFFLTPCLGCSIVLRGSSWSPACLKMPSPTRTCSRIFPYWTIKTPNLVKICSLAPIPPKFTKRQYPVKIYLEMTASPQTTRKLHSRKIYSMSKSHLLAPKSDNLAEYEPGMRCVHLCPSFHSTTTTTAATTTISPISWRLGEQVRNQRMSTKTAWVWWETPTIIVTSMPHLGINLLFAVREFISTSIITLAHSILKFDSLDWVRPAYLVFCPGIAFKFLRRTKPLVTPVSHNWSCDEANFYCCMMWFITVGLFLFFFPGVPGSQLNLTLRSEPWCGVGGRKLVRENQVGQMAWLWYGTHGPH